MITTFEDGLPPNGITPRQEIFAALFGAPNTKYANVARQAIALSATTISNASDLADSRVGFHVAFMNALAAGPDPAEALAIEMESDGRSEVVNFMGDAPGFDEWKGERKMGGLDAFKLAILENRDWSSGLRIKANDFKDDKLGLLPASVRQLAAKARLHRSNLLVDTLIAGFTALSYDGGFFFNTTRATGSNKLTLALDAAGLAAASLLLDSMTTYDGNEPLGAQPTHLIVGPKLRPIAEDLLKLNYIPNSAGTATQSNRNMGRYDLIVSPRLRGVADDYWFLADLSQPFRPLRLQMREEITTTAQIAPSTEGVFGHNEYRYGAQARYAAGYFEHRLIVGSQVA